MIRILESTQVQKILGRRAVRLEKAVTVVRPILEAVRKRGDRAVIEYARQLDRFDRKQLRVPTAELAEAAAQLRPEFSDAVSMALKNIRMFAEVQLPQARSRRLAPGLDLSLIVRPLETVGAYIPAGRYPLPSTLLMTVAPAQVAGVKNIVVASPRPVTEVLGTAHLLGVENVFLMGGAHAIAAMAFGTQTVPKADRIVGPGSVYVAAAKRLLAGEVGIDFIAGPTEVLIVAPEGDARFIAADMLAQAEHDVDASAVLLTPSRRLARAVADEIERRLKTLPTAAVARKSIDNNGAIITVRAMDEAMEISNRFAPEHLCVPDASYLARVENAGAVFVGAYSPEAAGDYASGTNHVLPTGGGARLRGGLSAADFVKVISVQQLSPDALRRLAPSIVTLARAEGLEAHARSIEVRIHE